MAEEALAAFRELGIGYEAAKALAFLAIAHGQQGKVLARPRAVRGGARAVRARSRTPSGPRSSTSTRP